MQLPECADLCDCIELAALASGRVLTQSQILRQFFPGSRDSKEISLIREAMDVARRRKRACGGVHYPFLVDTRTIKAEPITSFNLYQFLLFGCALKYGGPINAQDLLRNFRKYFEDIVCWSFRRAGFTADVLSEPREPRGLHVRLAESLQIVKDRFGENATLKTEALSPDDNDLDVDVLAVARPGNRECGGWPIFLIQCATGAIDTLQSKISEGKEIFNTVWDGGFFVSHSVRGAATPDCLLALQNRDWRRLSIHGWVLDRTRIVHLASFSNQTTLPSEVNTFWQELAAASGEIDWRTGWQPDNAMEVP